MSDWKVSFVLLYDCSVCRDGDGLPIFMFKLLDLRNTPEQSRFKGSNVF